jgi:hypothetical protein
MINLNITYTHNNIDGESELGYVFLPACLIDHPCHRRLIVKIASSPTYLHFDPECVSFNTASAEWGKELIKVYHPWKWKNKYQVLTGRVILRDRLNRVVEAFTFGGKLTIKTEDEFTQCVLVSSAPILPVEDWHSTPSTILAEEVEILLAEWRELFDEENLEYRFEEQLAIIDPFQLYLTCLDTLREKFIGFPSPKPAYLQQFICFLNKEIFSIQEARRWPIYMPPINKLLNIRPKEN